MKINVHLTEVLKRSIAVSALLAGMCCLLPVGAADVADETPTSVVRWICPDEPFADGIGKMRYYRKAFMAPVPGPSEAEAKAIASEIQETSLLNKD